MNRLAVSDRLGWGAIALASIAALGGLLIPELYRDRPLIVDVTRADNLFQLVVALPVFLVGMIGARRGSAHGRMAVLGTLMYLAYFFGLYAVAGVINAMTLVHIAVTGLAVWAVLLGLPALDAFAVERSIGPRLFRRSTIAFLLVIAGFHIPLWVALILGSVASGELPASLVAFGWLNTPVFLFDLAFALPLGIVAAVFLARRDPRGSVLGVSFTWFSGLLGLDMFGEQLWLAATGSELDISQALPFGSIALASALVLLPVFLRRPVSQHGSVVPAPV
jgi:hypothetical protein